MNADSDTIHDAIQTTKRPTQLPMHNSEVFNRLLDICEALNRRIDAIEARTAELLAQQVKQSP